MQETQETWVESLGQEDPLEEGMATHSSSEMDYHPTKLFRDTYILLDY